MEFQSVQRAVTVHAISVGVCGIAVQCENTARWHFEIPSHRVIVSHGAKAVESTPQRGSGESK